MTLEEKMSNKVYPFNKQWNTGELRDLQNFSTWPLRSFLDRMYKVRQMEEMHLHKALEEKNTSLVYLCRRNIEGIDTRIAYEEKALAEK